MAAPTSADLATVGAQLGRSPRALVGIAHRCPCGSPDVVATAPRLPDGSPFPTYYYLTCPRLAAEIGTLEAGGLMRDMTDRLARDDDLRLHYAHAHSSYLLDRTEHGEVPEIAGISAGGMPGRVKCLHALVAHSLAAGPGVNPIGDEALDLLPPWWSRGSCAVLADSVAGEAR